MPCSAGQAQDGLAYGLAYWLAFCLACWLAYWLANWLAGVRAGELASGLAGGFACRPTVQTVRCRRANQQRFVCWASAWSAWMVGSATLVEVLGCIRVSEPRLDKNRHLELKTGWRAAEPCAGLFRVTAHGVKVECQGSHQMRYCKPSQVTMLQWSGV